MFALSLFEHKILPFLDIFFEVKGKENTIQNLLAIPKWLSVLLFQYKEDKKKEIN